MSNREIRYIAKVDSTNSEMERLIVSGEILGDGFTLFSDNQTNGRGQQGNKWNTVKGKNLAMSVFVKNTNLPCNKQFILNEWVAVSVATALQQYAEGIRIKWPNDIYFGDKKLCGILIENSLSTALGTIDYSIVGIGVNINQQVFDKSLPNPVSLWQILGKKTDIKTVMSDILAKLDFYRSWIENKEYDKLLEVYYQSLYRKDEWHLYKRREVSLKPVQIQTSAENAFKGCIRGVDLAGQLLVETEQGEMNRFHFKEIEFVI